MTPSGSLLGRLQTWPLNILVIAAVANVSYFLVEQPFIRLGRRLIAAKKPGNLAEAREKRREELRMEFEQRGPGEAPDLSAEN